MTRKNETQKRVFFLGYVCAEHFYRKWKWFPKGKGKKNGDSDTRGRRNVENGSPKPNTGKCKKKKSFMHKKMR